MLGKIYKITNLLNGKVYIGQTKGSLKDRFQKHSWGTTSNDVYHQSMAIKKAIRKYGKENFTIDLLEEVEYNLLDEREMYWIECFDSYNTGYNCTRGGQNGATRPNKLSEAQELELIKDKQSGMSSAEAASKYGIDRSTVKNIFKRHGIKMPVKRSLSGRVDIEEFKTYIKTAPSISEVETKFNICKCSVYNLLKRHSIEYNFSKSVQVLPSNVED